jgi:hypothetical protein
MSFRGLAKSYLMSKYKNVGASNTTRGGALFKNIWGKVSSDVARKRSSTTKKTRKGNFLNKYVKGN